MAGETLAQAQQQALDSLLGEGSFNADKVEQLKAWYDGIGQDLEGENKAAMQRVAIVALQSGLEAFSERLEPGDEKDKLDTFRGEINTQLEAFNARNEPEEKVEKTEEATEEAAATTGGIRFVSLSDLGTLLMELYTAIEERKAAERAAQKAQQEAVQTEEATAEATTEQEESAALADTPTQPQATAEQTAEAQATSAEEAEAVQEAAPAQAQPDPPMPTRPAPHRPVQAEEAAPGAEQTEEADPDIGVARMPAADFDSACQTETARLGEETTDLQQARQLQEETPDTPTPDAPTPQQ